MSLYFETAEILKQTDYNRESLKAKVYGNKALKSPPASIYALASEATKWSAVLTEVIEKSGILALEKKVRDLHYILHSAHSRALPFVAVSEESLTTLILGCFVCCRGLILVSLRLHSLFFSHMTSC